MIKQLVVSIASVIILALPAISLAQESGLSSVIRAEILKDPRSASIPQPQIDAMVAALAQAAQEQGVTESDITWKPAEPQPLPGGLPADCNFLCYVNAIFGFSGTDYTIPIGLGTTSALLILFISMMLHRHDKHGIDPTVESIHTHS